NQTVRSVLACVILLCAVSVVMADDASHAPPALPQISEKVFAITDHGAVAGDATDNTKAMQATIDAAAKGGGGVVEVSAGEFLSGPIQFESGINLRLDDGATLKMLPIDRYPGGTRSPASFISGQKLHDIAITGHGMIDGQGAAWWPLAKTQRFARRPRMIALGGCDRILIEDVK